MLVAIENKSDISRCQTKFKGLIKKQLRQCENLKIGHLGGQISSKTYLNGKGVWWSYQSIAGSRHWNAFGLFVKKSGTQVIKAEINFPLSGIDRSVAGVFARGPVAGAVYILHNGRVGGGAAGVSKARFVEWYRGSSTTVFFSDGRKEPYFLLARLDDQMLFSNIMYFVVEVDKFKEEVRNGNNARTPSNKFVNNKKNPLANFNPEFAGTKSGSRASHYTSDCKHGRIVNALEKIVSLQLSESEKTFNNQLIDLAVEIKGDMKVIFEVKSSSDKQSIYTGIGQLLFHSMTSLNIVKILVLPKISIMGKELRGHLKCIDIVLLEYTIKDDVIHFVNFNGKI